MKTRKDLIMGLCVGLLLSVVLCTIHYFTGGILGDIVLGCLSSGWGDKLWDNHIKPWLARRRNEND